MEKVHNQKTKSKRSIETDYDMPVPDQKESDKILYKRIKDWYNSLTKQELEDYENLYNTTEDAYVENIFVILFLSSFPFISNRDINIFPYASSVVLYRFS